MSNLSTHAGKSYLLDEYFSLGYIPAAKLFIVNHIDQNNGYYRTLITLSIVLMILTNLVILESLTHFPVGWLTSSVITAILMNCCSCLKKCMPSVFYIGNDSLKIYEFLHENRRLIYGGLIWSIVIFFGLVYL